ncbi:MAG: hypothetical protein RJA52_1378 [Bacteroidota bacterium]
MLKRLFYFLGLSVSFTLAAQEPHLDYSKFRQLYQELPTPNNYRTASGAPGHEYYQQKADYIIKVTLDEPNNIIRGTQTVTYHNNSPDPLTYLWIQLDQNVRAKDSDSYKIETQQINQRMSFMQLARMHDRFDGGFNIEEIKDGTGKNMDYTINKTMMRLELPQPLLKGQKVSFNVKWWYKINDRLRHGGRSGYEYFPEDDNHLYTIAQFYPRMAVYNEVEGWQNKQFLGQGEFALTFGDYEVHITAPSDHIVAATGELQNDKVVLSSVQRERLEKARKSTDDPVFIVTQEEALAAEKQKSTEQKTWIFKASNVRDFAFASSRKFIWDAMAVQQNGKTIMAMSAYPKEGNPLWEKYSTRVVAHTLNVYSSFTFDYPYPLAWSIHADRIGMEYPMICFNFGRPEKDGTYSDSEKYRMIMVIIHEVGHNYFPMIVNSDERQWTWMDEGINSFLQFLAEQEWDRNYPSAAGQPSKIVDYMKGPQQGLEPIMTNSESILQFGNNAYNKPATALNILRETIMGRDLFDYAFKEYAKRWKFKHPTPADFFRTMEDASAVDLDWFWRGWFYSTDYVDIALEEVNWFKVDTKNPEIEKEVARMKMKSEPVYIGDQENLKTPGAVDKDPRLKDFYNDYDPLEVTPLDLVEYKQYVSSLQDWELDLLNKGYNYYSIKFSNKGGLVMPIILQFNFSDDTHEIVRIPAEIWAKNQKEFNKVFFFEKEVKEVVLDPFLETADTDRSDNFWPPKVEPSRFELFKGRMWNQENAMQRMQRSNQLKESGN